MKKYKIYFMGKITLHLAQIMSLVVKALRY